MRYIFHRNMSQQKCWSVGRLCTVESMVGSQQPQRRRSSEIDGFYMRHEEKWWETQNGDVHPMGSQSLPKITNKKQIQDIYFPHLPVPEKYVEPSSQAAANILGNWLDPWFQIFLGNWKMRVLHVFTKKTRKPLTFSLKC